MDDLRTVRSFCRNCAALCGIHVEIDGERVVRVRGDVEHPLSQGYTCSKGRSLGIAHHDPRRLDRPAIRHDGELVEATWDECLDDLAASLHDVIDRHGPDAVAFFIGSGGYYDTAGSMAARGLSRALRTRSLYSDMSLDTAPKIDAGLLVGGFPTFFPRIDHERARLVIYIGANKVISHGQISMLANPVTTVREITRRGALWVIDPRRTETAKLATRHLAPRPGTDYAILAFLAFLARELLVTADRAELEARTTGVEDLVAAVAPFDVEHAASISGLRIEELSDLLAALRAAGRVAIETGTGASMSPPATVTEWLTWAVLIITDSVDGPGGVWCPRGFYRPLDGANLPIIEPDATRDRGPASRPELRSLVGEMPGAALADEIIAGNVRAIVNVGANLVTCLPGADDTVRALRQLDVLACLDVNTTATTALATHVLATTGQLERPDLAHMDWLFDSISSQYSRPVLPAGGQRRPMWRVLVELGDRLGVTALRGQTAESTDDEVLASFVAGARASMDELRDGTLVTGDVETTGWLDAHIERLGGWRLAPLPLVERLAELEPPPPRVAPRVPARTEAPQLGYDRPGDRARLYICASDARPAGVADGHRVRVVSEHGSVVVAAELDDTLRPGTVALGHGWEDGNVNLLTSGRAVDPLSGMPVFSAFPVELEPAERASRAGHIAGDP